MSGFADSISKHINDMLWHDFSSFPKDDEEVLAISEDGEYCVGYVYEQGLHKYWCESDEGGRTQVTHWTYLPDPPAKKSEIISPEDFCYRMLMLKRQLAKEEAIPAARALMSITLRKLGYGCGIDYYDEILHEEN